MKNNAPQTATTTPAQRVASQIRAELARRQITRSALEQPLNLSRAAVARRLMGDVAFDVNELAAIADLLGVSILDLVAPLAREQVSA